MSWLVDTIVVVNTVVLVYFLLLNGGYLVTTGLAVTALRRHAARARSRDVTDVLTAGAPPITLVAPAYNEGATCVESANALLALVYPDHEVLMVNDGSKDDTLQKLIEAFDLVPTPRAPTADIATRHVREVYRSQRRPNFWVIDKDNGGKADALNVGVNYCRTGLFCALDADTLLERDSLARVVRPFLEDSRTMAVGGIIRIVNDSKVRLGVVEQVRMPRSLIAQFQVLEYLRAFLAGRVGWDVINSVLIISGAFGLFRRSIVVELNGFATDTVGEDMELVVRIHRHCRANRIPYRIGFIPDPVAWTECPERWRDLGRQRDRWQRGLMQVLSKNRSMLLNPRYGRIGMVAFPYFFFLEGWGPLVELAGYLVFGVSLVMGWWTPLYALAFFCVAFVFGAALSIAAIALEELSFRRYERWSDLARLLRAAVLEPFGYRQLATWWRVKGVWSALRGVHSWGAMQRRGFQAGIALAFLCIPSGVSGQEMPWSARVGYTREVFARDGVADWQTLEGSVARRFTTGSLALGAMRVSRFDRDDGAFVLDAYRRLWKDAYGNLRFQATGAPEILPSLDVSGEVFQSFRDGWEPSLGYRHMAFEDDDVRILSLSVARFVREWYGRGRLTHASRSATADGAASFAALLRRYLGSTTELIEVGGGIGGEAVTLGVTAGGAAIVDVRRTSFVALAAQKYVARHVGISAGLSTTSFEGVPRRTGGSIGLMIRWR